MEKKSADNCIKDNDFEAAFERFKSTTKQWLKYWYDTCKTIANNCKDWLKKYVFDDSTFCIRRIGINLNNVNPLDEARQKVYLFRFFDGMGNFICSKIGTTTRDIYVRLQEELRSKTYKEMGCTNAIIDRVYDCGNLPAEGLESCFRAEYIKKYPQSFKKNDRFVNVLFDLDEADRIVAHYLEGVTA